MLRLFTDSIVFAYARMNPPTPGHREMVDFIKDLAEMTGSDHMVVLSHTHDNSKNPLHPLTKLRFVEIVAGPANYVISDPSRPSLVQWLTYLSDELGYRKCQVVCGSDRVDEYQGLVDRYNQVEFHFDECKVISSGARKPGVSSTAVRKIVKDMDYRAFRAAYPDLDAVNLLYLYEAINTKVAGGGRRARKEKAKAGR
jgi:hypothetical protein